MSSRAFQYLLAKTGFDTAENDPLKVFQKLLVAKVRIQVRKNIGPECPECPACAQCPECPADDDERPAA